MTAVRKDVVSSESDVCSVRHDQPPFVTHGLKGRQDVCPLKAGVKHANPKPCAVEAQCMQRLRVELVECEPTRSVLRGRDQRLGLALFGCVQGAWAWTKGACSFQSCHEGQVEHGKGVGEAVASCQGDGRHPFGGMNDRPVRKRLEDLEDFRRDRQVQTVEHHPLTCTTIQGPRRQKVLRRFECEGIGGPPRFVRQLDQKGEVCDLGVADWSTHDKQCSKGCP